MTWDTAISDIEDALAGLSDGPYRRMGQALLSEFKSTRTEYIKENAGNSSQVTVSAAYTTWSTVTVPLILSHLRTIANQYDGLGLDASGASPFAELALLKKRLQEAARKLGTTNDPAKNLLNRAAEVAALPAQPPRYSGGRDPDRDRLAEKLSDLEVEAALWLALVA